MQIVPMTRQTDPAIIEGKRQMRQLAIKALMYSNYSLACGIGGIFFGVVFGGICIAILNALHIPTNLPAYIAFGVPAAIGVGYDWYFMYKSSQAYQELEDLTFSLLTQIRG